MNTNYIIKAKNLVKRYDDLEVLNIDHIQIEEGVLTSIVGPSGSGKSTLLHILGTLLKPTSGHVYIDDVLTENMKDNDIARLRNQKLGFVFQHHNLLPEFTALENVFLPAMIANRKKDDYLPKAKELLDYIGLADRMDHKPTELSGGEQQRVSIARSIINEPKMILADEPTGNLDSKNAEDIHQLFISLNKEMKHTFLVVTHNLELADLATRKIKLKDGKLDEN